MKQKRYRYILFDLDRTLWDFATNSRHVLKGILSERLPDTDQAAFIKEYEEYNVLLWKKYDAGEITKEDLRRDRFSLPLHNRGITDPETIRDFSDTYLQRMLLQKEVFPHTFEVLDRLKGLGCRMAVVTNGFREMQYNKLERSGLSGYFDHVIISDEVGFSKPSPGIFRVALERLGGNKEEAVMIGDSQENDIEGAQVFGIDQIFFNSDKTECYCSPTYVIDSLEEINGIII